MEGVINPERWNFYDWIVEMKSTQVLLVTFTERKFILSTFSRRIKFCSLRWRKRYYSTSPHGAAVRLAWKFFSGYELMRHPSSIREPPEFEFLLIKWRESFTINLKTWTHYCPLRWNFWCLAVCTESWWGEEAIVIGLHERGSSQPDIGHRNFFRSVISHRVIWKLH